MDTQFAKELENKINEASNVRFRRPFEIYVMERDDRLPHWSHDPEVISRLKIVDEQKTDINIQLKTRTIKSLGDLSKLVEDAEIGTIKVLGTLTQQLFIVLATELGYVEAKDKMR